MIHSLAKFVICAVVCNLLLAGSAMAESQVGAITLTPAVGYHLIDGGMDLDDAAVFGLGVGYNFSPHWSIEADLRYTPTEASDKKKTDIDIWTASLGGVYHLNTNADFIPYLSMGAGVLSYVPDGGSNDEDYFGYYGGGVKYALSNSVDLRLDARHLLNYRSDDSFSTHDNEPDWRHHLQTVIGLTFQLDGRDQEQVEQKPVAVSHQVTEKPSDADHDGIFTPLDLCPETAPGVRVDDDGCPADTDGDGVEDFRDACVDTPKGAKVDSRGCPAPDKRVIFLTRDITFGFDKDKVTPFHYKELARISEIIEEHPGYTVLVEGHADDTGTVEYNQELSERRAEGIRETLVGRYGIDDDRVGTVGFGLTRPIAGNKTAEERMKNRRVEITIHP